MTINACGLQAAEANRAVLRFLKEADNCWGVTPASGTSREMRVTKSSLTAKKNTVVSNELRADRMVSDVVEVAAMSGGDINVEFSAGSLDDFLEAFLLGTWTKTMTFDKFEGSNVSWAANNKIRIAGVDKSAYFTNNNYVKTEGFLTDGNNGYFKISGVSFTGGNTDITVTTTTSTVEAGSSTTRVMDANDVVILKSAVLRFGTAGNTIDSNGGNAFAAAKTAGQLVVGAKIFVQFESGYEIGGAYFGTPDTGSVTVSTGAASNGDTVTIDDGIHTVVFTYAASSGGETGAAVTVATGASQSDSAQNLKTAIDQNRLLNVGTSGASNVITLTNRNVGTTIAAADSITVVGANLGRVDFSGLSAAQPADGDTLTVSDGLDTVIFEFDSNDAFTRGNEQVVIGASVAATATNLHDAIMNALWAKKFKVKALMAGDEAIRIVNINPDEQGSGSISDSGTNITSFAFAHGDDTLFGFFTLTAVADDQLTVSETVGVHPNGEDAVATIKASHIRNPGTITDIRRQSFTIEQGFADVSQYLKFTGMRVGSFSLDLKAGEIVSGQIAIDGKETTTHSATVIGQSPYTALDTTSTPVMNATVNVGNIYKNGAVLASALQALSIKGEAALRNQMAVSSKFPAGIGTGRFNLTGKMTAYFETLELYDIFLNHDDMSLMFDFLDGDFNAYWFTVPKLKVTTDPIAPGGIDQDVLEEMEFVAFRDPNLETQFMVDRFSSILAA